MGILFYSNLRFSISPPNLTKPEPPIRKLPLIASRLQNTFRSALVGLGGLGGRASLASEDVGAPVLAETLCVLKEQAFVSACRERYYSNKQGTGIYYLRTWLTTTNYANPIQKLRIYTFCLSINAECCIFLKSTKFVSFSRTQYGYTVDSGGK